MEFRYADVQIRSDGSLRDQKQVAEAQTAVAGADDVLILVHGWNNDMPAARALYERLADSIAAVRKQGYAADRQIAVIGVLWPSIKWADEGQVAGGGASAANQESALIAEIGSRDLDPAVAEQLKNLVTKLNTPDARRKYLELLRTQLPRTADDDEDAPPTRFVEGDTEQVFKAAGRTDDIKGTRKVQGGAAGLGLGNFVRAARNLLNLTTYYTMRDRAGTVGAKGIATLIEKLDGEGRRIHLVGHSFGARAASAAANAAKASVHSLVLLQGAFSHYGFAHNWNSNGANGIFRDVPKGIRGAVVITHTKNDKAVGYSYALASRLAKQVAVGIGGPKDRYGGLGRNGALKTPEALDQAKLEHVGAPYAFQARHVSNLQADTYIKGHTKVTGEEVAYAVLSAVMTPSA